MRKCLLFGLLMFLPAAAQQASIPTATALPGQPFFIKKTWPIGGAGNWDYLTLDAAARRLYIAHGQAVQVVDLDSGSLAGEISGFSEAHAVALDDSGTFGYVSDGPAATVAVFNRGTLKVETTIGIGCSPRSLAFEAQNKLVFVVCGASLATPGGPSQPARTSPGNAPRVARSRSPGYTGPSHVVVIDTENNEAIANIELDGDYGFAAPDADGHVYFSVGAATVSRIQPGGHVNLELVPPHIAEIDAAEIADQVRRRHVRSSQGASDQPLALDRSGNGRSGGGLHSLSLPSSCSHPAGLAVDAKDARLFAACDDRQLRVLNLSSGQLVAALVTGPGDDGIGYDQDRGLIFVANGGGYGSLTIVQQDAITDSYSVVQTLPTMERARTLAVDSSTGNAYLVTDLHGVDLTKTGGIGALHSEPVQGSFQVLVVAH